MSIRGFVVASCTAVAVTGLLASGCGPGSNSTAGESQGPESGISAGNWQVREPLPTARTEVAATATDTAIVVVGGVTADGQTGTTERYDPATGSWDRMPDLPVAVDHAMAASDGVTVWVVGGYRRMSDQTVPSDTAWAWRGDRWQAISRMPEARAAGGAAVAQGRLYVAGGIGPDGLASETLVYDPELDSWDTAPGLVTPREHLGVTEYNGRIYALGGRTTEAGVLDDAEFFDPAAEQWEVLDPLPTARGGVAAATVDGLVVVAGGETGTGPLPGTFDEVEAWDVASERWIELPPLPTARHGLGLVGVDGVLHAVAGGPERGFSYSTAHEAFTT